MINIAIPSIAAGLNSQALAGTATTVNGTSFGDLLKSAIGEADGLQTKADAQISNLLQGAPGTDVGSVMASVEKAGIAFQLMLQVRNKVVSAYQDVAKMQF